MQIELTSRPQMALPDTLSKGLAPQAVEQIFQIVKASKEGEGMSGRLAGVNISVVLACPHQC
ncbi:hypothetical protein [Paracoccus sp. Ld10]|uniref:hypothetical protein n=1 Tax=Paracoccus sp. Ld10 TaxID=649158 RepID=UPI00386745C9